VLGNIFENVIRSCTVPPSYSVVLVFVLIPSTIIAEV
jgi:hypothetical protein